MKNLKYMKHVSVAVFLVVLAIVLLPPTSASADCTKWHPHHCLADDIDDVLVDIDRKRIDLLHLGGQGCRAKANDVIASNRSGVKLTELEKRYLRPWFGKRINLDAVRVSWGASLNDEMKIGNWTVWVASDAQTFGYRVFVRERHKNGNTAQLITLAHELTHILQYENAGRGLLKFCQRYMSSYSDAGGYFSSTEAEAFNLDFRFAQWISDKRLPSWNGRAIRYEHGMPNNSRTVTVPYCLPGASCGQLYFKNNCSEPLELLVRYKQLDGDWKTGGWWTFGPGKGAFLASSGTTRIRVTDDTVYYYARIPNTTYSWSGNEDKQFNGNTYPMKKKHLSVDSSGNRALSLNCSNR